jgi:RNA polymerase sigma-70 factor (ECF subfamily)
VKADERTDELLMAELSQGRQDALAEIMRRYQRDVFRFCYHYVRHEERAKDLAQETFVRVFAARGRFDPKKQFKPWLLCIARHLCFNDLRKMKVQHTESLDAITSAALQDGSQILEDDSAGPGDLLMALERKQALFKLLDTLSEDARELMMLRYFERLHAREIAEITGLNEANVRTKLYRILKQLQEQCAKLKEEL